MARNGFTLVEMLVAMLLLSLVGLALAQFQTFQLSGTQRLSAAALARLEADNLVVDLLSAREAPRVPLSGSSSNGGRTLAWQVTPTRPADPRLASLVQLDLAVMAEEGGPVLARRTLVRMP
ncbi:MAG: type II secretion system protein [Thermaurantiacus sp.]